MLIAASLTATLTRYVALRDMGLRLGQRGRASPPLVGTLPAVTL